MRVIVTGASSGIGYQLALQLARSGSRVLVTARRKERLDQLIAESLVGADHTTGQIHALPGNLTDPAHRAAIADWCYREWGGIDTLVNNAGAGAIGPFADASADRLRRVMEIDFFAPVELTRICLPLLLNGISPAVLNIGSVLGHRAVPDKSEYCAAKFAMRGWSESIRVELAQLNVEVLMVSPSTTKSEFFDSLVDTNPDIKSRSLGIMSPERVAQLAIRALVKSKRDMILSLGGKVLVWLGRFFPRLTDFILTRTNDDDSLKGATGKSSTKP
ncbi:MAG: SDR family NAD(P)-dependent oxidoreductase [Planctomycetes bacterium]|nr:SDR family NAD(P)-dependent oxidoreductase [Planctomycetota bacterium]